MYTLKNDLLKIAIKKTGAELCKIESIKHSLNFMWDANPDVWGSYAPNLFPIIGGLKNNSYIFDKATYEMPKHGFLRHNESVKLYEEKEDCLIFKLSYSEALLKMYPFKFDFFIAFKLIDNVLDITHTVKNLDDKPMYFSLGGHPAFKCPLFKDESYDDYVLEFEHPENSHTHLLNMENGLVSSKTKPVFNNSNILALQHHLFHADALIFKDLKSRKVSLKSNKYAEILSVNYPDFDYLGIWAKPNGDYVCIEPWLGVADHENTNQQLDTKEGIIKLDIKKTFKARYSIEINKAHLL